MEHDEQCKQTNRTFCPNVQQDKKKTTAVVASTGDLVEVNSYKNGVYQCYNSKSMLTETYNKDELIFT